jgi:hypothetical protein
MTEQGNIPTIRSLIDQNQQAITSYYRAAIGLLVLLMAAHVVFAGSVVIAGVLSNLATVAAFATFNATVIVIEVLLCRITFMAASRAGQLHDIRMIIAILGETIEPTAFEQVARTFMLLRRDQPSSLRVFDLEAIATALSQRSRNK